MARPLFLTLILGLLVFWMEVFHSARAAYPGPGAATAELRRAREGAALARRETWLAREHFLEFRQTVASLMPGALRDGVGREIASVVGRRESTALRGTIAKTLFETGKREFAAGRFDRATRSFQAVIRDFGYTPYVTESYFLVAEGYFKSGQPEACAQTVRRMIELFPQSEFTGLAMVRLGGIYRSQNRNDEAIEILTTVMRAYPQRDVAAQAKATLRQLDL